MRIPTNSLLAFVILVNTGCWDRAATVDYPFQDASLSVEKRVDDLVSRLTSEEKIAQMYDKTPAIERLGIPSYEWWNEALHGVARAGKATVFPQAIGIAATFDEDLMFRIATAISDEGRAKHHNFVREGNRSMYTGLTFWSPNINIFRDPRWGRGQETYGEDPYLTGRMAVNFVKGLQGDDPKYLKTVATIKHFAVHSGPEKTRHSDDYDVSNKDLKETYLPAFKTAVQEANVQSLMCAYNRFRGDPACGSDELIKDYLRRDFGFTGYIVSDCGALADFYDPKSHHVVETPAEAAAWAVKTGTDVNCGDHHGNTMSHLNQALKEGLITEDYIDIAVKRLFTARFKLGMFDADEKVSYASIPMSVVGSEAHLALTREASEKSLVLLKNDGVLPLKRSTKVAVVGPNADNLDVLLGNYNGNPINPVSPLEGILSTFGEANVTYAVGASLIGDVYTHHQPVEPEYLFHADASGALVAGLNAKYFASPDFDGAPALERVDPGINFEWLRSPLDDSIEDEFGIRWTGVLIPKESARYQFGGNVSLKLDGRDVDGIVSLKAGQKYALEATRAVRKYWHSNAIEPMAKLSWLNASRDLGADAVTAARNADVIIYVGGISSRIEGEEMPLTLEGFESGDRTLLKLPDNQQALMRRLKQTGKPLVYVNFSGSGVGFGWAKQNASAIVQAFYPGEAAGAALAGLLVGDYNPSGRLPVTFYESVSDLPPFGEYAMANRTYRYFKGKPLYSFGYGLSYTTFDYSDLKAPATATAGSSIEVSAVVSNTGSVSGEDVAQLYLTFVDAPGTPIRALKAFKRVSVDSGQRATVSFVVEAAALMYFDADGAEKAYVGALGIAVGGGQAGYAVPTGVVEATIDVRRQ